jgi:cytochrome c1
LFISQRYLYFSFKKNIMKLIQTVFVVVLSVIVIAACKAKKNAPVAAAPKTESAAPAVVKSTNGIYAPGEDELKAIQKTYPEVSLQTLTDGYQLYIGACTNCHPAKNIYTRTEEEWTHIVYDMARKSKMNSTQEDAVSKFVMAIKATQPQ